MALLKAWDYSLNGRRRFPWSRAVAAHAVHCHVIKLDFAQASAAGRVSQPPLSASISCQLGSQRLRPRRRRYDRKIRAKIPLEACVWPSAGLWAGSPAPAFLGVFKLCNLLHFRSWGLLFALCNSVPGRKEPRALGGLGGPILCLRQPHGPCAGGPSCSPPSRSTRFRAPRFLCCLLRCCYCYCYCWL
jgi:hypothetical protein